MDTSNFRIVSVSPSLIQIEILDLEEFTHTAGPFSIGSFLRVKDPGGHSLIAIVQSYRIKDPTVEAGHEPDRTFVLDAQPIGYLSEAGVFTRGGREITIPPREVQIADQSVLDSIYSSIDDRSFCFGNLANAPSTSVHIDGDRFFGKHIGIVGSTGAGKSCTVSAILQAGIKKSSDQQKKAILNNSHIFVFDLHGEYRTAFPSASRIDIDSLILPYWLMNAEELEEFFVDTIDRNNYNQVSQFRQAVLLNKKQHNPGFHKVSCDSPIYFKIEEVINYLQNLNAEVIGRLPGEDKPKLKDGTLVDKREDHYFSKVHGFVESSQSRDAKATNGPFAKEFDRLIPRIEARYADSRLDFLIRRGEKLRTNDIETVIRQFMGYTVDKETNIILLDLSGIPFEVLSVVVSLISRLLFDFAFFFKKVKPVDCEVPVLVVYEEAHNYIPNTSSSRFDSVRRSIERIAKEGRKYGISLMIVSQRPSEISETVFSQCNNFVVMRLSNPSDQDYVRRLLPDSIKSLLDSIPQLERQEAIVLGDSVMLPSRLRVNDITDKPDSNDIKFHHEWVKDWYEAAFSAVIAKLVPPRGDLGAAPTTPATSEVLESVASRKQKPVRDL